MCVCVYAGQEAHPPHASRSSYSLQFFSSDWSSQSNSPSHLQPKLMHMPLLHMNSTDLQGWWEAAHAHTTAQTCHSRKKRAAARCSGWTQEARFHLRLLPQADRDHGSNVGPEHNQSFQLTIANPRRSDQISPKFS